MEAHEWGEVDKKRAFLLVTALSVLWFVLSFVRETRGLGETWHVALPGSGGPVAICLSPEEQK